MIVVQAPSAQPQGFSIADAARRIRAERKEQQAVQEEMARRVLQLSGVDKQIDEFPKTLSEAFKGQMARMDSRFSERYQQAMLASFTSSKIRSAFTEVFERQIGHAGLTGVLPWYESPVGRKITAAEDRDPDAATHHRNFSEFAARIQKEPPGASRIRLINELELQVRSTDHTVGVILALMRALVSNLPGSDPQRALAADVVRSPDFEKGFRDALVPELEKRTALSDLYIYSTLSDAELEQYLQFLSSPHGQTMTRAVWSGFEHSFEAAGAEVAHRLAALPPEQP